MSYRNGRYISKNGFSPKDNREIGRAFYRVVFLLIFGISIKIWGYDTIDDIFIFFISLASYKFVGYFLHRIGFWPRWSLF